MKKTNIKLACILCVIVLRPFTSHSQECFEGNIRMIMNADTDHIAPLVEKSGKFRGILREAIDNIHGENEMILKSKGNKVACLNTLSGEMIIIDDDKGTITISYPKDKCAAVMDIDYYYQLAAHMAKSDTFLIADSYEVETDDTKELAGVVCKSYSALRTMGGKNLIRVNGWWTDAIQLTPSYGKMFQYGANGFLMEYLTRSASPLHMIVTQIETVAISDETFILPEDYNIFNDYSELMGFQISQQKKSGATAKKVKAKGKSSESTPAQTAKGGLGRTIPDLLWDY